MRLPAPGSRAARIDLPSDSGIVRPSSTAMIGAKTNR